MPIYEVDLKLTVAVEAHDLSAAYGIAGLVLQELHLELDPKLFPEASIGSVALSTGNTPLQLWSKVVGRR